jgi:hypothetical protein
MEEIRTMDYQRFVEILDEYTFEFGFFDELLIAQEIAIMVQENPNRLGKTDGLKTEVICIVYEQPSKWATNHTIDGYVVIGKDLDRQQADEMVRFNEAQAYRRKHPDWEKKRGLE